MKQKMHFIGIGGIGMSSLAKLMLMQKHQVSGSDLCDSDILHKLKEMGALIHLDQKKRTSHSTRRSSSLLTSKKTIRNWRWQDT
jgi:UDP-N-acetylmuramate-alanine ligase